jgi:hypothetical protein
MASGSTAEIKVANSSTMLTQMREQIDSAKMKDDEQEAQRNA